MKEEILFERKKYLRILFWSIAVIFVLGMELIIMPKSIKSYQNSSYFDVIIPQILLIVPLTWFCWRLEITYTLRFYEDGISYLSLFARKFLLWNEIKSVKVFKLPTGDVFSLSAKNKKVGVSTIFFCSEDKIIKFLKTKLEEFMPKKDSV